MNRIIICIVVSLFSLYTYALPITEKEALQKAQAFMQGKDFQHFSGSKNIRRAPQDTKADNAYYVFNVENNGGFVIIAGDDVVEPVIGYATEGYFDNSNLPENMLEWLDRISAQIKDVADAPMLSRASSVAPLPVQRAMQNHRTIEPLIITTWNQGNSSNGINTDGVYNIKCPMINGQFTCTGCVATAGAQLMYYYKYPQTATKIVPGYQLIDNYGQNYSHGANTSADLPSIQFQWNKMQTNYTYNDPNTEAVDAVADLMLYCGYAAHMNYGVDGSSASTYTLAQGMVEYFDYDPNTWKSVYASSYSISEWDELMYNELAQSRPIIYCGDSKTGGGHAFICDGYDGNGFYHFNFGWGGSSNGPYKLYAANDYIKNHDAIIGLQPNTGVMPDDPNGDDEWEEPVIEGIVATASNVSVNGTAVTMRLDNDNETTYGFGFGIGELNSDGTVTPIDTSKEYYKNTELNQGWGFPTVSFDFSSYSLSEGTHKLVPISLLNGETEWKRCHPANVWFEVKVADGQKTVVKHPIDDLQIDRFTMASGGTTGSSQAFIIQVTNNGDNFDGTLYLYDGTEDDNGSWAGRKYLKIKAGNTKEFRISTGNLAAGTHVMRLLKGYAGDVIAQINVDIKVDLAATNFDVPATPKFTGSSLPVDVTIENHAGDYIQPLYLFASNNPDSKGSAVYVAGTGIEGGRSDIVRFYFKPETAGTWYFWVSTASSPTDENLIGQGSVVVEEAPTSTVTLQLTDKKTTYRPNGKVTYEITVKNTGNVTNYRRVFVYLWAPTGEGNYWSATASQSSSDKIIEPGETATFSFTFEGLADGNEYSFDPWYYTTYQMEQYVRFNAAFYTDRFTYQTPSYILGDVNGDGDVDIADAVCIVNHVVGKPNTTFIEAAADANNDGDIDIADAVHIVNYVVGKIPALAPRFDWNLPEPE
jgi:hypothetical protein